VPASAHTAMDLNKLIERIEKNAKNRASKFYLPLSIVEASLHTQ